ncbi:hypothetical protein OHA98_00035 [Streptomyces sp. NBC_00654]|uniref:hypothetical protein n=1 Tax=Streptomyces sp. NBC_00654 TaxID=2975799 RepID=UPI00225874A9|nr:hypothetical protein [Streptomyces sp. NBC_00654]MCX4963226.1 hypothetical protein [Streptomyces sp. NBC_00654]
MSDNCAPPGGSGGEERGAVEARAVEPGVEERGPGAGLPATLHIAGLALVRTESPPSLACWTGYFPEPAGADPAGVSLVMEPAAPPDEPALRLAHDVVSRFDAFVGRTMEYCRTRLRERQFELTAEEVRALFEVRA